MTTRQWKIGDKVKLNSKATSSYTLTQEGAIGTIIQVVSSREVFILFTKKENTHLPELSHWISKMHPHTLQATFVIDLKYCSSLEEGDFDFSNLLSKKIKEIDTQWATTRAKKGNKYALLLLQ